MYTYIRCLQRQRFRVERGKGFVALAAAQADRVPRPPGMQARRVKVAVQPPHLGGVCEGCEVCARCVRCVCGVCEGCLRGGGTSSAAYYYY